MDIVKNRNYLLLLIGRVVTNIGDSLYYVTTMWLVYKLGGNAFYTGLAGFLTLLPASLQFITGPFVDQWQVKNVNRYPTTSNIIDFLNSNHILF